MSEWWTYRPSDFLMFAPRTYWRLFELHNEAWWPLQPLLLPVGLGLLAWLLREPMPASRPEPSAALRAACAGHAGALAFVAWAFLWRRYAPINWAAEAFAAGFVGLALCLAVPAVRGDLQRAAGVTRRRVGLALYATALLALPWLAPLSGRPWAQAELPGLAPDPTVMATLGLLLAARSPAGGTRWLLRGAWALSLGWCVISAATLATMGSFQALVPLAAVLVAVLAVLFSRE